MNRLTFDKLDDLKSSKIEDIDGMQGRRTLRDMNTSMPFQLQSSDRLFTSSTQIDDNSMRFFSPKEIGQIDNYE